MKTHILPDAETIFSALMSINPGNNDWLEPGWRRLAAKLSGSTKIIECALPLEMQLALHDAGAPSVVASVIYTMRDKYVAAVSAVSSIIEE